jgi:hypothetical protein
MNQKYFLFPFATAGDLTEIPNPTQGSGVVSYQQGFGSLYSENPLTVGTALEIDRAMFNAILYDMTTVLQNYQQNGSPEWIDTTDNGGAAFSYRIGSMVRYSSSGNAPFTPYLAIADNVTAVPTEGANWSQVASYKIVNTEVTRAEAAEATLQTNINTETARAEAAESALGVTITNETSRAEGEESTLQTQITNEVSRAETSESTLQRQITNEVSRAETSESTLQTNINTETARAEAAESLLAPKANPVFTGNGSIGGAWSAGGTITSTLAGTAFYAPNGAIAGAALLATTSGGYLNIGTGASTISGTLGVGGAVTFYGTSTFEGLPTVYGPMQLFNAIGNTIGGELYGEQYGSAPGNVIASSVGLAGGPTSFTATTGWVLNTSGAAGYSSFSGSFGFMTGYNSQAIAFYATSDYRAKDKISTITPEEGLRFVTSVTPRSFAWRSDDAKGTGYIAQELVAAGYEHLVSSVPNKDMAEETAVFGDMAITSPEGMQLIAKYDDMIAYLHAALIDAFARIDALEARLG